MNAGVPLATLGITCFNAESTIERALISALKQSWANTEVVVVDDLSSDRSVAAVERMIAGRSNARLVRHELNSGPAAARNTILAEAKGEFVAFFDDDDESLPERVTTQIRCVENYERRSGATLIACCASGLRRYPNGYNLPMAAVGSHGEAPNGPEFADYLLYYRRRPGWFYGGAMPACSLLARRSVFRAVGGFDPNLRRVEDNDFAIRLALMGGHFVGTPEVLFVQHSTNAPDKRPEKNLEGEQAIVRKHRPYLESIGRYYYALHWHKLRYWHFKRRYAALFLEFAGIFIRHPIIATRHFFTTAPRRLIHEWRMSRKRVA
jgi:glycosyltransferase involved in cell wall biosynthesis